MRFLIKTSGKGMLPADKVIGHIEADTAEEAENNLISKGSIPQKYRGFFDYVADLPYEYSDNAAENNLK